MRKALYVISIFDSALGKWETVATGGMMKELKRKSSTYNKPDLLNGPFLVVSRSAWLKERSILVKTSTMDLS